MQAAGYGIYQQVQTQTSSPGELILLLYDALLKNLARAEQALLDADREAAHAPLLRAQDIVLELIASLDVDHNEIARQLAPLYEYQYRRLLDANVHKDAAPVREVVRLLTPLRDAWAEAVRTVQVRGA